MTTPAEYVLARSVLLDALGALGPHLDAVILVGAQAVYLHTGDADLNVPPTTTDADLVLAPSRLRDSPLLEDAMRAAGFTPGADPGAWRGRRDVAVDLMVPEALSGRRSRRSARLPVHGDRVARRTAGLEAAILDNELRDIVALDPSDRRRLRVRVAGPAALLVAKVIKIEERRDQPLRQDPKDGLDVLRILQAVPTERLAQRLKKFTGDVLAGDVTRRALEVLRSAGTDPNGHIASLAARSVGVLENPDTIAGSVVALVDDLLLQLS